METSRNIRDNFSARSYSRLCQDWTSANSSGLPSSEFSKQDVRRTGSSSKLCETTQKLPLPPTSYNSHHVGSQNYDWRQDTPFWNYSRQKRKENVINWGLSDPPPSWVPPHPPPAHVTSPGASVKHQLYSKLSGRKSRESLSPVPHQGGILSSKSRVYPGSSSGRDAKKIFDTISYTLFNFSASDSEQKPCLE